MLEKWDTLGTFTQKVPFLDYNKTKKMGHFGARHFGVMDCIRVVCHNFVRKMVLLSYTENIQPQKRLPSHL